MSQITSTRLSRHLLHVGILIFGLSLPSILTAASAQTFPSRAIRIIIPASAGSPPDIVVRLIATTIAETEGWRIVIENRPG